MRGYLHSLSVAAFALVLSVSSVAAAAVDVQALRSTHHQARANDGGIQPTVWKISDVYQGENFYDGFEFFTRRDPTKGWVNYVSLEEARAKNLTHADSSSFVIRGDNTRTLKRNEKRDSVRIFSKKKYARHIQIADVEHMPEGNGTWPAYWVTGDNWPANGEIDIIEGANDQGPNLQSLHTTPGCTMRKEGTGNRVMKGTARLNDCNSFANGNSGCGVHGDSIRDFGPAYNKAGGGYWVTMRSKDEIKMWFWSRQDPDVPDVVKSRKAAETIDPDTFGTPTSHFNSEGNCDIDDKFGKNTIVFNLTFCGGFAGHGFPGGIPACEKFVRENPEAYNNAFFNIHYLRVYEQATD